MNRAGGAAKRKLTIKVANAKAVERRLLAFERKAQGWTLEEIGREMGVSAATISTDIARRIREMEAMASDEEGLTAHWHMAMTRLEAIFRHHFELSAEGNAQSAAICLRAIEQMSRLAGLDAGKPGETHSAITHSQIADRVRAASPALFDRLESLGVAKKIIARTRSGVIGPQGAKTPPPEAIPLEIVTP